MAHALSNVEGFKKRSDMFYVHPDSISVIDGWNDRIDFTGEEELMESIKEVGVLEPLEVKKTKDNKLELSDGERRLRATLRANKEGADIQSIPVTVVTGKVNEIDLYIRSLIRNTGKPLTPSEEANSFKRLVAWGYNIPKIAKTVGRSYAHVKNRLELAGGIDLVKIAVDKKEITLKEAGKIIDKSDGKVDIQIKELEKVKIEKVEKKERKEKEKSEPKIPEKIFTIWSFCQDHQCKGYSFQTCNYIHCGYKARDFIEWMQKNSLKIVKE